MTLRPVVILYVSVAGGIGCLEIGPKFGYFPNAIKTHLLVKPGKYEEAQALFGHTQIQVSCEGKRYLRGTLRSDDFAQRFFAAKVAEWTQEIKTLDCLLCRSPGSSCRTNSRSLLAVGHML